MIERKCLKSPSDSYTIIEKIGEGRYGVVHKVYSHKYKMLFCLKTIDYENDSQLVLTLCKNEAETLRLVAHPYVIRLYEYFEQDKKFYYVTEYCPNGILHSDTSEVDLIGEKVRLLFRKIFEAVSYFHSHNIAHRDLKPQNIALDTRGNPKILDWGFSTEYAPGELLNTFCGTYPYLPPEVFKKIPYDGAKADIWSLGVTLYVFCFGVDPWGKGHQNEQLTNLINSTKTFPPETPPELIDLINKLMVPDPDKRITAKEALMHPYLVMVKSSPTQYILEKPVIFRPTPLTKAGKWLKPKPQSAKRIFKTQTLITNTRRVSRETPQPINL